jgi:hypothetical protein
MDIIHAYDIIHFQCPKKRKRKKNISKDLLYPNTLSHTSPQCGYSLAILAGLLTMHGDEALPPWHITSSSPLVIFFIAG